MPGVGGRGGRGARATRLRFDGWIAGLGTASGTRIVVGHWPRSPFGPVGDVMLETATGHRRLLAVTTDLAEFVAATYTFDRVDVVAVEVRRPGPDRCEVRAGPLELSFAVGRRGPLGTALRALPPALAASPRWVAVCDPAARLLLPGVRTRGSAGGGRREWYGARDLRPIVAARARLDGEDLGALAPVTPPVRFGFGSPPARPSVVRITTTIELPPPLLPGLS